MPPVQNSSSFSSGCAVCFLISLPTPCLSLCLPVHRLSCLVSASSLSSSDLCSRFHQGLHPVEVAKRPCQVWVGWAASAAGSDFLSGCLLLGQPFGRDDRVQGEEVLLLSRRGLCLEVNAVPSSPACARRLSVLQQVLKLNSPPNQLPHWALRNEYIFVMGSSVFL